MPVRAVPPRLLPRLPTVLLLVLLAALPFASRAAEPVEGVDYASIPQPKRWNAADPDRIEVVEVFGYWCHHCANFEPMLERWKQSRPADVRVEYLPLPRAADEPLSIAYFASQAVDGLARTHAATFTGIHAERSLPANPTLDEITAFYAGLGVDADRFRAAAHAPAREKQVQRAREFAMNSGVTGTPTLIVDGRYRVTARTLEDNLRIAEALVARIRAERD